MAKASRMSADKTEEIIGRLSLKNLRTLFFDKYGPIIDGLMSREQILSTLEIDTAKMNALELKGLDSLLGLSLHNLKKFAQKRKYNWIEITVSDSKDTKRKHVYYGFTSNLDEIDSCMERFQIFKKQAIAISTTHQRLGVQNKRQLELSVA